MRTASPASRTVRSAATGPNVSSFRTGMSSLTSASSGVAQNDEWIGATELQDRLLHDPPGELGDPLPGRRAAGERHRADAVVRDQRLDVGAGHEERPKEPIGEARVADGLLEGERALRD